MILYTIEKAGDESTKCDNAHTYNDSNNKYDCHTLYNCCDCGGNGCGCCGCFSCNACEHCLND